jgi:protein TonB
MYAFILLFAIPSMIGYAGCTSDHNPSPDQKSAIEQRQKSTDAKSDSLKQKKAPEKPNLGVEMPTVAVQVPPIYPEEARKKGIQGEVQVQILVGADGIVKEATVISNKTGSKELEKAALDAVYKWKFNPGKLEGKPVQVHVIIPIKFKLKD